MRFSEPKLIFEFEGDCYGATYSPDGSKIAFESSVNRCRDIYLINADGSGLQKLTDDEVTSKGGFFDPQFSPDGNLIVCVRYDASHDERPNLYLIDLQTNHLTQLTTENCYKTPRFSPDSKHIAFTSYQHERPRICLMNLESKQITTLSRCNVPSSECYCDAYTQNGRSFIFHLNDCPSLHFNQSYFYSIDLVERTTRLLFSTSEQPIHVAISPNSQIIAFNARPYPNEIFPKDIHIFDLRAKMLKRLKADKGLKGDFFWQNSFSPDGRFLLFHIFFSSPRRSELCLFDVEASELLTVAVFSESPSGPQFHPDGKSIILSLKDENYRGLYKIERLE